ncbi:MAG: DUF2852 domain-containing protein [Mangrovicoccus sp.]
MIPAPTTDLNWLARAELWLDQRGKGAWIALTVLSFIFFWPMGLALLAYMIWGKNMFKCKKSRHKFSRHAFKSSGNSAFDAYKAETLRRLEDEQDSFQEFLKRLRDAKDKAEFDQFMADRDKGDTAPANNDYM